MRLGAGSALVAATLLAATPGLAAVRTVETEHFAIHAPDEMLDVALRAAEIAERAYGSLTALFQWRPARRIDITLAHSADDPNGMARVLPRNEVFAVAVPPGSLSTLNDFEEWLSIIVTHELAHVVHMDVTLGLARVLNALSGKVLAPNAAHPAWFLEGLAVYAEGATTGGGRIGSSLSEMFLRAATLEGALLPLDELSNVPRRFPYGTATYLYGGAFVAYLVDRFGPGALAELSHRYGRRLLSFGVNRAARETLGAGWDQLWGDFRHSIQRRYGVEADDIRARGLIEGTALTRHGEGAAGSLAPRFLTDGTLVYYRSTSVERPRFVRLDPATGRGETLLEVNAVGAPSPTPDGRALVFPQVNHRRLPRRIMGASHAEWDDLFRLDLATRKVTPISDGARLHEPAVSPDGSAIACTQSRGAALDLVLLKGGTRRVLVGGHGDGLVYTPAWSPDGKRLAYVRWSRGGTRDLWLHDLRDGSDRALTADRALDADPQFSPDGRYLLFSSDRTGVYNIHALELGTGRTFTVTNVLGGAFQPAVSSDAERLVYVGFSSRGFDLFSLPYDPAAWRPAPPSVETRVLAPPAAPATGRSPQVRDYQPWRHMAPRRWDLAFGSDPLGLGPAVSVSTSVEDPVRHHALGLAVQSPLDGDAAFRADYTYTAFWPDLALSTFRSAHLAGGLVVGDERRTFRQHAGGFTLAAALPVLRKTDRAATLEGGYAFRTDWAADRPPVGHPAEGIVELPRAGRDAGVYVAGEYSDARSWNWSISAQEGRTLRVSVARNAPAFGGRFRTTQVGWSWREYFTPPWANLHALALAYHGGVSSGDRPQLFALGGFEEQDLVRAFFQRRTQCCLFLRGYPAASIAGPRFHAASAEYRAPLLWIERGAGTFPLYLRRLSGALFGDAGTAFSRRFRPDDLRYGVGGELRLELTLAWRIESHLAFGAAKGLSKGGSTDYYMVSAFPF